MKPHTYILERHKPLFVGLRVVNTNTLQGFLQMIVFYGVDLRYKMKLKREGDCDEIIG